MTVSPWAISSKDPSSTAGSTSRARPVMRRPTRGAHLETNASCPEPLDAGRTMLGFGREAWLYAGLARSKARWNLIAQDVLMAQLRRNQDGIDAFWTDDWNGYPANRARLLQHIHNRKVPNPVVISGDIHSFFANDLKLDFDDQASPLSPPNSSAARSPHTARHTIRLRRCCRTIPMCIFSTAGGAVMSSSI